MTGKKRKKRKKKKKTSRVAAQLKMQFRKWPKEKQKSIKCNVSIIRKILETSFMF